MLKQRPFDLDSRLTVARKARENNREGAYRQAALLLGADAEAALRTMYEQYDERLYRWLAELWDPAIGGFYYSASGRDTEGYLPDIESTAQALNFLHGVGIYEGRGTLGQGTPSPVADAVIRFTRSLQDPEDGYFYHPQWGKNIIVSRRGRDLSWSVGILRDLGATPLYPTPLDRARGEGDGSTLPSYLQSKDAFCAYLEAFEEPKHPQYIRTHSYPLGNLLSAQAIQIVAAGEEYVDILIDWLNRLQLENGLWEPTCTYASVNGLMKISSTYVTCKRRMPRAKEAMMRAIETVCSPITCDACVLVYNPWVAISNLQNMLRAESPSDYREIKDIIVKNAAEMIHITDQKLRTFEKEDGSYSYFPDRTAYKSQAAPVALPNTNEGDVNASCIVSNGTPRCMCASLGIPRVPLFCKEDGDLFFELLSLAEPAEKHPVPQK